MSESTAKRLARTRSTILAAAESLFLARGYLGTSMDDVARTAPVSKQTLYAHVKSKEALFVEVVERMTGSAAAELKDRVADPPPDRKVAEFLFTFAVEQLRIVMTPRLMQLRRLVIGEVSRFPELGAALHRNGPGRSITRLQQAFAHYHEQGQLVVPDAHQAATFFNWLVMGGPTNDAMLLGDAGIPHPDAYPPHAAACVRIFLAAYGGDDPR